MSAAAASPIDGIESVTSDQAIKAGIIAAALGGSAMIARLLLQKERASLGFIIRSSVAACVTAYFVNLGARDYVSSESLRVCICGIAGFAAPEIQNYGLQFIEAKFKGKVSEAKRAAGLKEAKPRKPKKQKKNAKR
jgi:hypothetical protein